MAQTTEKTRKKVNKKLLAIIAAILVVAVTAAIVIPIFFPGKETIYVRVEEIQYSSDGVAHTRITWEYDKAGNVILEEGDFGHSEPKWDNVMGVYYYEYVEYDGTVDYSTEWEYDENGNVIRYRPSKYAGFSAEYDYDENGVITGFDYQWEPGPDDTGAPETQPVAYKCEYDDEGRLVRVYYKTSYGEDFTAYLFEYDKDGTLEKVYSSRKEGTWRHELSYDDGRLDEIEITVSITPVFQTGDYSRFGLERINEYQYDRDGNPKSQEGEDYTYDEHGNLIEIEYENGSRIVYTYEEMKVTPQQAQTFRRRNGDLIFTGAISDDWYMIRHLVPHPLAEQE